MRRVRDRLAVVRHARSKPCADGALTCAAARSGAQGKPTLGRQRTRPQTSTNRVRAPPDDAGALPKDDWDQVADAIAAVRRIRVMIDELLAVERVISTLTRYLRMAATWRSKLSARSGGPQASLIGSAEQRFCVSRRSKRLHAAGSLCVQTVHERPDRPVASTMWTHLDDLDVATNVAAGLLRTRCSAAPATRPQVPFSTALRS